MNAIISLCHFCENHGPSVIFCTHPIRPHAGESEADDNLLECGGSTMDRQIRSPTLPSQLSNAAYILGQSTSPSMCKPDTCEGCHSIDGGYVSHDEEACVSYVSKQYPHHPLVFSMVRQACVRSLSCEVCLGREGPIFFGDEQRGHVLSYTFYIPDSQSRGLHRWYSILVIMMDKVYLLNSWPFLIPNIQLVIEHIQSKAKIVYDLEQAKCPQRRLRLQTSMTPSNFRQQRGVSKSPRSLIELTDDKNVFKLLHVTFTWIIKACGNRVTETFLEGPPTEDSIIDMEKQEETEEGFIKLFSKKLSTDNDDAASLSTSTVTATECDCSAVLSIDMLRLLMHTLGSEKFHVLAHHVVIGNQIVVKGDTPSLVASILSALKILLPRGCCRMLLSSDRYEESWKCNLLGMPLSSRIPNHVVSTERFLLLTLQLKSQTGNVLQTKHLHIALTASSDSEVGSGINKGSSSRVDRVTMIQSGGPGIVQRAQGGNVQGVEGRDVVGSGCGDVGAGSGEVEEDEELEGAQGGDVPGAQGGNAAGGYEQILGESKSDTLSCYSITFTAPAEVPEKSPHVLAIMESALSNDLLSNKVVEQCLICLKEEWMNKVKVLFKFTKAGGGRSDEDTKKLIQVVGAGSEDMPLLKFWMTGLSVQYRTHILSTSKPATVT